MEADYVIIGAGSAGCAVAYRLAEAGKSVLVIEHGGTDWGPLIQMPAALSYPMNMSRYAVQIRLDVTNAGINSELQTLSSPM